MARAEDFPPEPLLVALCESLAPQPLPPALWGHIESRIAHIDRFEHFAPRVADLLDVALARARHYLQDIDTLASWGPGPTPAIAVYHLQGGPRAAGAITGFVKVAAGESFPMHTHHGEETVLVLQGALRDQDGAVSRPGEVIVKPASSAHVVHAEPGEDAIYFVIVRGDVEIGGQRLTASDPRL